MEKKSVKVLVNRLRVFLKTVSDISIISCACTINMAKYYGKWKMKGINNIW